MKRTAGLTNVIHVRLKSELLPDLEALAKKHYRTVPGEIRQILQTWLEGPYEAEYDQRVEEAVTRVAQAEMKRRILARRKQFRLIKGSREGNLTHNRR